MQEQGTNRPSKRRQNNPVILITDLDWIKAGYGIATPQIISTDEMAWVKPNLRVELQAKVIAMYNGFAW